MSWWDTAKGTVGDVVGTVTSPVRYVGGKVLGLGGRAVRGIGGQTSYQAQIDPLNQNVANQDLYASRDTAARQTSLADVLRQRVAGKAPSVAALQGQQGVAQAFQNAQRIAAGARGVNRGLALRAGAEAASTGMAQAARDASMLRAQEQVAAEQTLGQQLAQQRAQDLQTRAGSIEAARANQLAQVSEQEINAGLASGNAARGQKAWGAALSAAAPVIGAVASDIRVKEDVAPATGSFAEQLSKVGSGLSGDSPSSRSVLPSATLKDAFLQGMSSAGQGLMMSDRRVKEDLAPVQPYTFRYKPEMAASMAEKLAASAPPDRQKETYDAAFADAREPRQGVMTQELLKSPRGKKLVLDTPEGQAIEGRRALSFVLANQAGLDKRMRKLEGARV